MNKNKYKNPERKNIKFPSFIALNRHIDRKIFEDSKLLTLLIYIALRVSRTGESLSSWELTNLNPGEFVIGRLKTVKETDLTEAEYRTRFRKLQQLKIIRIVKTTNKFTIGRWLENSLISLNIQPANNQQNDQPSTTNNNINTNNNIHNDEYKLVLNAYMKYKDIKLYGEEVKDTAKVIKKMFQSKRQPKDIISFMKWLHNNEDECPYYWVKNWNIWTIFTKLPEFLAGKFKSPNETYIEL